MKKKRVLKRWVKVALLKFAIIMLIDLAIVKNINFDGIYTTLNLCFINILIATYDMIH